MNTCSFDCQILVTSVVTLEEVKYMYFLIDRSLCDNHCVYSRRNCVHAFFLSYWTFIKREKNQEQYITIITVTPRHTKILITLIHCVFNVWNTAELIQIVCMAIEDNNNKNHVENREREGVEWGQTKVENVNDGEREKKKSCLVNLHILYELRRLQTRIQIFWMIFYTFFSLSL